MTRLKVIATRVVPLIVACGLIVGLQGCNDDITPLPEGMQTMTGVLVPSSISVTLRGSHVLLQNGIKTYFVESAKKDLRDLEGVDVVITGTLEQNVDPRALPVLVASGVTLVEMPVHTWEVLALKLILDAPAHWNAQQFEDGIRFTQTGSTQVLLRGYASPLTQLPAGTMLQVEGRRAIRTTASGSSMLYIQNGRDIIAFAYTPASDAPKNSVERDFNRVIRSIHFTSPLPSTSSAAGSTGSTSSEVFVGAPCGGPAGVLCPSGQYCAITDSTDGVGRCRQLKQ